MKPTIQAIIVDDELPARNLLTGMLNTFAPQVNVLAACEDVPTAVKAIRKYKPSLVFLDIEMPRHSGLEILEFFNDDEIDFSIIFVTGYSQYAINALQLAAVDYLLKPLDSAVLEAAITRYEQREEKQKLNISLLMQNLSGNSNGKIAVPSGDKINVLEVKNIAYLKADNSYTEIHMTDKTTHIASRTLKNFEDILPKNDFLRSHKSYMVNLNEVAQYSKADGGWLKMNDGTVVSISAEKADEFLERVSFVRR